MYCFFPVISDPTQAHKVEVAMVSCHRINGPFDPPPEGWVLDSGGYKQLTTRGPYRKSPKAYVQQVGRLERETGGLLVAFHQDYPVSREVAEAVGISGDDWKEELMHRNWQRYLKTWMIWRRCPDVTVPIAPVLQGDAIRDYVDQARRLTQMPGSETLVGIGGLKEQTVGKKMSRGKWLLECVRRIRRAVPHIRGIHALGIGKREICGRFGGALRRELWGSDSAAWSSAARFGDEWTNGDNHDMINARAYRRQLYERSPLFECR